MKKKRTKSQVAKYSRIKGSNYERKICKLLTKWWDKPIYRTPISGGSHWKGDGVTMDPDFPFHLECKNRQSWKFEDLFREKNEIMKYWKQCENDALESGKIPLLIFTKNYCPDFYMMSYEDILKIEDFSNHLVGKQLYFERVNEFGERNKFVIGLLSDLFKSWSADMLRYIKLRREI